MARCDDLISRARASAANLRFDEVLQLAVCLGFVHARTNGSHHYFKREGYVGTMNFQPGNDGTAKPYQVRQALRIYDDSDVSPKES